MARTFWELCQTSLIGKFSCLAGRNRLYSQLCMRAQQCPLSEPLEWFFLPHPQVVSLQTWANLHAAEYTGWTSTDLLSSLSGYLAFFLALCRVNSRSLVSLDSQFLNFGICRALPGTPPRVTPWTLWTPYTGAIIGITLFIYHLSVIIGLCWLMLSVVLKTIVWMCLFVCVFLYVCFVCVFCLLYVCFGQCGKSGQKWKS